MSAMLFAQIGVAAVVPDSKQAPVSAGEIVPNEVPQRSLLPVQPTAAPWPECTPPPPNLQFSIRALMLLTGLVAMCLSLTLAAPVVGILFSAACGPALVRARLIAGHCRARGYPLSLLGHIRVFITSLCVVGLIGVLTYVGFMLGIVLGLNIFGFGFPKSVLAIGVASGVVFLVATTMWRWPYWQPFKSNADPPDLRTFSN